jgi:hypothetical protein
VRRPDAGKASTLCFDHGAEVVLTQGTVLLEMGSYGRQIVVGQGLAQEQAVGFTACLGFRAERGGGGMRRQHGKRMSGTISNQKKGASALRFVGMTVYVSALLSNIS